MRLDRQLATGMGAREFPSVSSEVVNILSDFIRGVLFLEQTKAVDCCFVFFKSEWCIVFEID